MDVFVIVEEEARVQEDGWSGEYYTVEAIYATIEETQEEAKHGKLYIFRNCELARVVQNSNSSVIILIQFTVLESYSVNILSEIRTKYDYC